MKRNCLLFALLLGVASSASLFSQSLLFDFNSTAEPPTYGGTWNVIEESRGTFTGFFYADGTEALGVSLTLSNWMFSDVDQGDGWHNGHNKDWLDHWAAADYFYATSGTGTITFEGLDSNRQYHVHYLGARNAGTGRDTNIQVNDESTMMEVDSREYNTQLDGWTNASILTWTDVTPDPNGQIIISVESLNEYRHLNAIQLELVPEDGETPMR